MEQQSGLMQSGGGIRRILIRIAYDGTDYCGFQSQPNVTTIQSAVEAALEELAGERITLTGGSRTDSGVHSRGNVAVFDTKLRIPAEKIPYALNSRLPHDIVIQSAVETDPDFHPRHCDSLKTYEYVILNRRIDIPILSRYALYFPRPLDFSAMREAAKAFAGEHDFASFCSAGGVTETTVRRIDRISLTQDEDVFSDGLMRIRVTGNGFLYNMVRIMAGTLIDVGTGRFDATAIPDIIAACDRRMAGNTAPPQGLTHLSTVFTQPEHRGYNVDLR